jgi:hypothetical protein
VTDIELGALPSVDRHLTKVRSRKFALDSALEEAGFELPVPLAIGPFRAPKIAREL